MTSPSNELRGRRVLVLGADGFVGRWVARALTAAGADLHLSVLDPAAATGVFSAYGVQGEVHGTDLTDLRALIVLLDAVRPAVTFNLAGYGVARHERDERLAKALNSELPGALAHVLNRFNDLEWDGTSLIHVGSALEYGEVGGDLVEDGPAIPTTLYGRTKREGTQALAYTCQGSGLPGVTARLFMLYGPGEHPGRLLPTLIEAARTGTDVPLTEGRQRRDFTYVADAAEGLLRLAVKKVPLGAVCNLATGVLTPVRDFALTAADVLGLDPERLRFGEAPTRAEEMEHDPVNVDRLEAWSGWRPTISPREGVRATRELLRETGSGPE